MPYGEVWLLWEIDLLKEMFPASAWPDLLRALPRHSRSAICQKARFLGLRRSVNRRVLWSGPELFALRRHYSMSDHEKLMDVIPGRTAAAIQKEASKIGLKRYQPATRKNTRHVHSIILQLRRVREDRKITRQTVANKSGYHVNQILMWELGKAGPAFKSVCEWAELLGFDLVLEAKTAADCSPIPWPDRKKLMAGE